MAIILNSQPADRSLVYNDNTWSLGSTIGTLTGFRYYIQIIKSPLSATPTIHWRGYIYPRQEDQGKSYFDPKRILESLVSYDVAIPSSNHNGFFPNDNSHTEYTLIISEQTKNASNEWVDISVIFTNDKSVWNGGLSLRDWLSFTFTDYEVSIGDTDTKFLTSGPSTRYQNSTDSSWLYFIAKEDDAPTHLTVKSYDVAGTLLSTETLQNPHSSAITVNPFTHRKYQYMRVVTGRKDINSTDPTYKSTANVVHANAAYYTVNLRGVAGIQSELITYRIDEQCSKWSTIRLHWLNRLGGFDSFNFILKSVEESDIDRKSFEQQYHTWNDGDWSYTVSARGKTDYSVQMTDRLRIASDYMSDAEAVWMKELLTSPVVYQEIGSDLVAVNVKASTYRKQTSHNDKLKQYEIDLEYSLKDFRQRG